MQKTSEQLSMETTALFERIDKQNENIHQFALQLQTLTGNVDTLVKLMQESLSKGVTTLECNSRYDRTLERLSVLEGDYVGRDEFAVFVNDVKEIKAIIFRVGILIATPIIVLAVYNVFT